MFKWFKSRKENSEISEQDTIEIDGKMVTVKELTTALNSKKEEEAKENEKQLDSADRIEIDGVLHTIGDLVENYKKVNKHPKHADDKKDDDDEEKDDDKKKTKCDDDKKEKDDDKKKKDDDEEKETDDDKKKKKSDATIDPDLDPDIQKEKKNDKTNAFYKLNTAKDKFIENTGSAKGAFDTREDRAARGKALYGSGAKKK